jgi:gamma-glutamylcyclotransferase (GGCT)/AIG2-like uncharacterized protein YtfP
MDGEMTQISEQELTDLIEYANGIRMHPDAAGTKARTRGQRAEIRLQEVFRCDQRLAVYGTLAPGRVNHHMVSPLGGEWTPGIAEGDLYQVGWGAALGFMAFRPVPGGPSVDVQVLAAESLPGAWADLDRFEGAEYVRILVPIFTSTSDGERRLATVANLYAAAPEG